LVAQSEAAAVDSFLASGVPFDSMIPTKRQLDSLEQRDARADAKLAYASGDLRLWGLSGYGVVVPCTTKTIAELIVNPGLKRFPYSGHFIIHLREQQLDGSWTTDSTQSLWQIVASKYVTAYNRQILALSGIKPRAC
jgi:hypothetical protein